MKQGTEHGESCGPHSFVLCEDQRRIVCSFVRWNKGWHSLKGERRQGKKKEREKKVGLKLRHPED